MLIVRRVSWAINANSWETSRGCGLILKELVCGLNYRTLQGACNSGTPTESKLAWVK